MANDLIKWLLKEDILNLGSGLAPKEESADESWEDAAAQEAEALDQGPLSIADVKAGQKSKAGLFIGGIFVIILAAGAALFLAPPSLLGPLSGLAGSIQGGDEAAPTKPAPAAMPVTSMNAPATTMAATTDVAEAATMPTSVAEAVNDAVTGETQSEPEESDEGPWVVAIGPILSQQAAKNVSTQFANVYDFNVTSAPVSMQLRQLNNLQPVSKQDAESASKKLSAKGIPNTVTTVEQSMSIRVGPVPIEQADAAAKILVASGIQPKATDLTDFWPQIYIDLGPFNATEDAENIQVRLLDETDYRVIVRKANP